MQPGYYTTFNTFIWNHQGVPRTTFQRRAGASIYKTYVSFEVGPVKGGKVNCPSMANLKRCPFSKTIFI